MTLAAFHHEQAVKVGGDTLRLVLNFGSIDAIEGLVGRGFDTILPELVGSDARPPLGLQGRVVWGLLREHHPEISLDQAATLLFGEASMSVGIAMGALINAAFSPADPTKAKPANPRKPRGASRSSSKPGVAKA